MSIRNIIKTDMHELNFNDKRAYCEKPWHNRKIRWFNGGIGLTLKYLAEDAFKEAMYFNNKPKYSLSKIFICDGLITNKYKMSIFNKGVGYRLYGFRRRGSYE